jgi:hypothetical protein
MGIPKPTPRTTVIKCESGADASLRVGSEDFSLLRGFYKGSGGEWIAGPLFYADIVSGIDLVSIAVYFPVTEQEFVLKFDMPKRGPELRTEVPKAGKAIEEWRGRIVSGEEILELQPGSFRLTYPRGKYKQHVWDREMRWTHRRDTQVLCPSLDVDRMVKAGQFVSNALSLVGPAWSFAYVYPDDIYYLKAALRHGTVEYLSLEKKQEEADQV